MTKGKVPSIYVVIFAVSLAISIVCLIFLPFTSEVGLRPIVINFMLVFIPVALAEAITICHFYFMERFESKCEYERHLDEIGIQKIYDLCK